MAWFFFLSVFPERSLLLLGRSDPDAPVLLGVDVSALAAGRLDAHARGVAQLQVEALGGVAIPAEAVVSEVEVLVVLA